MLQRSEEPVHVPALPDSLRQRCASCEQNQACTPLPGTPVRSTHVLACGTASFSPHRVTIPEVPSSCSLHMGIQSISTAAGTSRTGVLMVTYWCAHRSEPPPGQVPPRGTPPRGPPFAPHLPQHWVSLQPFHVTAPGRGASTSLGLHFHVSLMCR